MAKGWGTSACSDPENGVVGGVKEKFSFHGCGVTHEKIAPWPIYAKIDKETSNSSMAQRKRAGLITRRSLDRNQVLLDIFVSLGAVD
jgi:hypothetical protein